VAQRPAEIFGLYPRKGSLQVGADADLVLWDPAARWTITATGDHHRCDHSIYERRAVVGRAVRVWQRGRSVVQDDVVTADSGAGRYLR
jgi:dihydropyrimidinase